jgi:hypothetical protein
MTSSRAELLRVIAGISDANPDLRLGQLIANLATAARGPRADSIWDCEDEEFLPAARQLLEFYRNRGPQPVIADAD